MNFHIEKNSLGIWQFSGFLDENSDMSALLKAESPILEFDLEGLKGINSRGVRNWIETMKGLQGKKIKMNQLPVFFVNCANQLQGFIPPSTQVISMQVPFFDEEMQQTENILFSQGKEINGTDVMVPPVVRSKVTDRKLTINCNPKGYFRFLKL